jgi:hypothetical protein
MIRGVTGLARESWVLGIACAAALAYAAVRFVESLIGIVLSVLDGYPAPVPTPGVPREFFSLPYTTIINGHIVSFEPLLQHSILLLVVIVSVALVLRATGSPNDKPG